MQPVLQLLVAVEPGELAFDQGTLALIDMTVSLGRGHQRLENRLTVQLDLRSRHAVQGLRLRTGCTALLRLPVTIGFIGQHAQRGETAVDRDLAPDFTGLFAAEQQAHGACRQCPATRAGEQAAEGTVATARALLL
ncbi:hypothetical protein D3C87_1412390 [compost metagenome]